MGGGTSLPRAPPIALLHILAISMSAAVKGRSVFAAVSALAAAAAAAASTAAVKAAPVPPANPALAMSAKSEMCKNETLRNFYTL